MSNYPERPLRKGKPKSTHSGSKKSRSWMQQPGVVDKMVKREEAHIDNKLCVIGHTNPALKSFLARHRNFKVPVGTRLKAGPRPYLV